MAISARDRQRKHSIRLRELGLHRTSVVISERAHGVLRQIASDNNVSQNIVIELGILAAAKLLAEKRAASSDE